MTTGSPPCITATTEFVVPKSIPIILLIATFPSFKMRQSLSWRSTNSSVSEVGCSRGGSGGGTTGRSKDQRSMHLEWHIVKLFDNADKGLFCQWLQAGSAAPKRDSFAGPGRRSAPARERGNARTGQHNQKGTPLQPT